jgi:hypothetical protein
LLKSDALILPVHFMQKNDSRLIRLFSDFHIYCLIVSVHHNNGKLSGPETRIGPWSTNQHGE